MGGRSRKEVEPPGAVGDPSPDRRGRDALGGSRGGRLLDEDCSAAAGENGRTSVPGPSALPASPLAGRAGGNLPRATGGGVLQGDRPKVGPGPLHRIPGRLPPTARERGIGPGERTSTPSGPPGARRYRSWPVTRGYGSKSNAASPSGGPHSRFSGVWSWTFPTTPRCACHTKRSTDRCSSKPRAASAGS